MLYHANSFITGVAVSRLAVIFNMARIILLVAFFAFFSAVYSSSYKCAGKANYMISFYGKWSSMTHENAFPVGGKFSPLVGCSHGEKYTMWAAGMKASPGVKYVAQTGNSTQMKVEIQAAIDTDKTAWMLFSAKGPTHNGTSHVMGINVEVTQDFPYVSLITMIAPSPDWFTGIMKTPLCNSTSGKWMDSLSIDMLSPWDAGTDNGTDFADSVDIPTDPPGNIVMITKRAPDTNFKNIRNETIPTLGKLMFKRSDTPAMTQCKGEQKYMVKVEALWNEVNHSNGFPGDPHFSPLVIATHTYRYKFWSDMTRASTGVKIVAETGVADTLYDEIMKMTKPNFVFNAYKGSGRFNSPGGYSTMTITVKEKYSMMSFITMIAPSPDWFVGLDSYDLCGSGGKWKDDITETLLPWDAGTDSGIEFESTPDDPTKPVDVITRITASSNTEIKQQASIPFAKITFKKIEATTTAASSPTPTTNSASHGSSAGILTFLSIAFLAILRLLY